jgi:hypothetical protein
VYELRRTFSECGLPVDTFEGSDETSCYLKK